MTTAPPGPLGGPERFAAPVESQRDRLERLGFALADWRVEPEMRLLVRGEEQRRLDPRQMEVLLVLAAAFGHVVSREQLIERAWQDTFVSENSLSQAISRLRRALGDDSREPRFIETVSRSGYRLLVEPQVRAESSRPSPANLREPVARSTDNSRVGRLVGMLVAAAAVLATGTMVIDREAPNSSGDFHVRPASTVAGHQFGPRLSPQGTDLAFAWRPEGSETGFDIWVHSSSADSPARLTSHPHDERLATWSPDARRVAFFRFSDSDGVCGLFAVTVISRQEERLADCLASTRSLDWSPQEKTLALDGFLQLGEGPRALFLLDLETGTHRQLTHPEGAIRGDIGPRHSPDGRFLAFEREVNEYRQQVWVIDLESGVERQLTDDAFGQVRGVDWHFDGRTVLFASNRDGDYALWSVDREGGAPARLPIHDTWITQPTTARSTEALVYRTFRDSVDLLAIPLQGETRNPRRGRHSSSRSERHPTPSPDGERLAFVSDRSGSPELWTAARDTAEAFRHTDFRGAMPGSPSWSPDGRTLAFEAAPRGQHDLFLVEIDSRRPKALFDTPLHERSPSFSRDGRALYFASDRDGEWRIWRWEIESGRDPVAVTSAGLAARETPDGRRLVFSRLDEPGLWLQSIEGGEPRRIVDQLAPYDASSWDLTDDGVYSLRRAPTEIWFTPFGAGEPRLVHAPARQVPLHGRALSVSPNANELWFSRIEHSDDELMWAARGAN